MNVTHRAKLRARDLSKENGQSYAANLAIVLQDEKLAQREGLGLSVGPYSTGGGGTVLEHRYGAVLLSHLLTQTPVPALGDHVTPTQVLFQANKVSKVDDILVRGVGPTDADHVLSVGVRRQPSLVPSEPDSVQLIRSYLNVVTTEWPSLNCGRWRLALAVVPACTAAHQLKSLASIAVSAGNAVAFRARMAERGYSNFKVRNRLTQVDSIVCAVRTAGGPGAGLTASELTWRLLSKLSVIELHLEEADLDDRTRAVERLQPLTPHSSPSEADALFCRLVEKVGTYVPSGAAVDLSTLHADLRGVACSTPPTPSLPSGLSKAAAQAQHSLCEQGHRPVADASEMLRAPAAPQKTRRPRLLWKSRTITSSARQPLLCGDTVIVRDGYWLLAFDAPTGRELWKKQTAFNNSPVLGAGAVYVADPYGHALPRDLRTGAKRDPLPIAMHDGLALFDRGTLYAADPQGRLRAIDPASRGRLWTMPTTGQPIVTPPRMHAGILFFQTGTAPAKGASTGQPGCRVWAVDAKSGGMHWPHTAEMPHTRHWTVGRHALYVVQQTDVSSSRVVALDVTSGEPLWGYPLDGDAAAAPVECGDTVFLTTTQGCVLALRATDGKERWRRKAGRRITTAPHVADGAVFVSSWQPDRLTAFDAGSGTTKWHKRGAGAFTSTPFTTGSTVCAAHRAGALLAWDVRTHKAVWCEDLLWNESPQNRPVVADGVLYVTTSRGEINVMELP